MSNAAPPLSKVLTALLVSVLVAAALLVAVVLPAEYGIDPLGTGQALGLLSLSRADAVAPAPEPYAVDHVVLALAPFESVEYKYRLARDSTLVYSWRATNTVVYDLHAEPDAAPAGYAESFDASRGEAAHGTYRAPFAGIHGWFWENRGVETVTVRLWASGFANEAFELRGGYETVHALMRADERPLTESGR